MKPHLKHRRTKGLKYVPLNEKLYTYLIDARSREGDAVLNALRAETQKKFEADSHMSIGRDQGSFMTMLVAAIGAKHAIEIGTFTGYSSICIARGLPERGKLLCLDASEEWTNVARKYWKKAGVDKKIELRLGPGADSLKKLEPGIKFDFAFFDADKPGYDTYYELVLPRMRSGGLILFDNMLWGGRLGTKRRIKHPNGKAIDKLNRKLAKDKRVQSVLLSIGDGVHMCRVLG
ncbi:O-methyltransferase [Pedosphaera parvula]|uniref:Caffeoyl-CoA O-methyltransferase n=1 Tax=Pedosphaera parvula (strain Ellin514) TaxID=320771 RepID=B9XK41_PEDPL|nr:class I SAM-dependent methyltransferase [Pedosphaera parvula]EEF59864.1 Caffeoyl-CoA O-methyltransferase [Pedosphaera parvula Ellin514]